MQERSGKPKSLKWHLQCDSGARRAVRDGMDLLILRCGTCGREVGVTEEELLTLRTINCWMCAEGRGTRDASAARDTPPRAVAKKQSRRGVH